MKKLVVILLSVALMTGLLITPVNAVVADGEFFDMETTYNEDGTCRLDIVYRHSERTLNRVQFSLSVPETVNVLSMESGPEGIVDGIITIPEIKTEDYQYWQASDYQNDSATLIASFVLELNDNTAIAPTVTLSIDNCYTNEKYRIAYYPKSQILWDDNLPNFKADICVDETSVMVEGRNLQKTYIAVIFYGTWEDLNCPTPHTEAAVLVPDDCGIAKVSISVAPHVNAKIGILDPETMTITETMEVGFIPVGVGHEMTPPISYELTPLPEKPEDEVDVTVPNDTGTDDNTWSEPVSDLEPAIVAHIEDGIYDVGIDDNGPYCPYPEDDHNTGHDGPDYYPSFPEYDGADDCPDTGTSDSEPESIWLNIGLVSSVSS